MTYSPKTQTLLDGWRDAASSVVDAVQSDGGADWQAARDDYADRLQAMLPAPAGVTFEDVDLGGVPTLLITPDTIEDGRALFYMHGGGYVHSAPRAYHGLAGHYARKLRARVYIPDYRQAPEYPFPIPIADTFTAYRALIATGQDPSRLAVSGDSAGGAMVVTVMRKARDAGIALPVAGVAISPWADLGHTGPSARTRDGIDPLCSTAFLDRLARLFLANELTDHPDASPIHANVRGLPPVLIQMGETEVMLSGALTLAKNLSEQKVRTTLEVWPDMFHVWHSFAGHMAEADEALDNAVTFLERELARQAASSLPES